MHLKVSSLHFLFLLLPELHYRFIAHHPVSTHKGRDSDPGFRKAYVPVIVCLRSGDWTFFPLFQQAFLTFLILTKRKKKYRHFILKQNQTYTPHSHLPLP